MSEMKSDLLRSGAAAAPPVVVSAYTLNDVVTALTLIYLVLQIAYLIWKWRRRAVEPEYGRYPEDE